MRPDFCSAWMVESVFVAGEEDQAMYVKEAVREWRLSIADYKGFCFTLFLQNYTFLSGRRKKMELMLRPSTKSLMIYVKGILTVLFMGCGRKSIPCF